MSEGYSCSRKEDEVKKMEEVQPAVATEELEPLPEEYLTEPVSVAQVCSIGQRLSQPDLQAEYTAFLQPKRKPLLIKRSQRCRECEHNLSKPEFSPASIKFKIQMAAFHHIPEVKIKSVTAFNIGEGSRSSGLRCVVWCIRSAAPSGRHNKLATRMLPGISPPPPFLVSPGTPAIPWPRWLRLFENFTLASGASELSAARRRALLLHCLGPEGQ
ncbi:hypothetical protein HPB49_003125 [Dermacentor silvarum]|uniref:Uncharacterized protein n=1 Tax=Dermacentor silvarum TaxID=543639 RepID=A0ACB8C736_DERSI|nr:hypothetical protein HPB49_003125 [Dermacentor silvarum]